MTITKAQRALINEGKHLLWQVKMTAAKQALEYLINLTPTSEVRNQLTTVNLELMQIEEAYNAQVRD